MFIKSKRFRVGWAVWTLILGISLFFLHTFQNIHSFEEYLKAFVVFDMPASWCPTFLTLYGASSLLGKKFAKVSTFAGYVLLPMGVYTTISYSIMPTMDPLAIQVYVHTIHISELLTGIFTIIKTATTRNE